MRSKTLKIRPEFSALGRRKPISPLLTGLIQSVLEVRRIYELGTPRLALELGCGQLRNLKELKKYFPSILLVDTEFQLGRIHDFGGKRMTVSDYVRRYYPDGTVMIMNDREFAASSVRPDVIFVINVMDVVPPQTRREILSCVKVHLSRTSQFASLVPRNDSRTLHLCTRDRRYRDGYLFSNHGALTFYKNWSDRGLQRLYFLYSLGVVRNLSSYRHSCLVCMLKQSSKCFRFDLPPISAGFMIRHPNR
jgi:hypothetical protein